MLKITKKHSGKMEGMMSLSTSSLENKFCQAMSKRKGSVCEPCYSNRMLKMYKSANNAFKSNGEILAGGIDIDIPRINASVFRFNAFGELININHMINLIRICNANPRTQFTLWTKRKDLVFKAIRDFGKPENLILVYSSEELNVKEDLPRHFDKVFTVWSKGHLEKINMLDIINCGEKKCFDCLKCYDKNDKTTFIDELVK